ncbi:MAG: Ribonuclease Y [Candidatus Amesbacteria bacterium GW2011_GWB1_47_26]|uniref:Ribonuclease Y n=1 Tax=Candidatus Amesbacteria bacterium GW2011_GWC2_45_19 TaxID=1618366 RepID=A0A0G1M3U7_9BACT|nr:MAG: Ribonuclease Y [Candidatus Amesbacteria bacterium GW2011_GWC2_45_19]KKU37634.1 MAG: Ribonuclease Y [Candidatus Amesbacteria bacterium GW2011_GWA1_46_35]KKU68483.1 MAG: coiled-coil [Microgenomates group bacterium GW2011_GWC1_47_20]KKU73199.1 MAG: Ribonuclease Y [Candidatus Amesbacteria bacterium GW2011_GWB1_47_26]KKU78641.1 MAG: Ribonuclease Y [Candidatus Amesbacteria bacterium GW2011_GWA2_47_70]
MDYQLISLVATGIAIVGVGLGYLDLGSRKKKEQQEAGKMVDEAQDKAAKILRQAQDKAVQILEKARLDTENRNEKLEIRLDRVEEKEMREFKKTLGQTTAGVMRQKVDEEIMAAQAQIEGYKVKKMQEVDAQAQEMVRQVTRAVLGKALDTSKHTALITAALEEAKTAHVL